MVRQSRYSPYTGLGQLLNDEPHWLDVIQAVSNSSSVPERRYVSLAGR